ncbi:MAG: hypothetical protein WD200_02955 [Candidatus Andersenbacteria bacterium]
MILTQVGWTLEETAAEFPQPEAPLPSVTLSTGNAVPKYTQPVKTIVIRASSEAMAKQVNATGELWVGNAALQPVAAQIDEDARTAYQAVWYKSREDLLTIYLQDVCPDSSLKQMFAQRAQTTLITMTFVSQSDRTCTYTVTRHQDAWTQRANKDIQALLTLYSLLRYPEATSEHVKNTTVFTDQVWQKGSKGDAPEKQTYTVITALQLASGQ